MKKYKREDYRLNKTSALDDLSSYEFDLDYHKWDPTKISTILPQEILHTIDDGRVVYKFNNHYFRSDDFKKEHNGRHILFSGCSETEGAGGNIEEVWSKILYDKISKNEKCSGFFNLARSGWGYQRIINNCLTYFQKYGYPDILFILLPNADRNFYYNTESNTWNYLGRVPIICENFQKNLNLPEEHKKKYKRSTPVEHLENFVQFLYVWKLFCEFCNQKNIRLIFSSWDIEDAINYKIADVFNDDYFALDTINIDEFLKEYYKNNQSHKNDIRKRDGHHGIAIHHYWAEQFYKRYLNE